MRTALAVSLLALSLSLVALALALTAPPSVQHRTVEPPAPPPADAPAFARLDALGDELVELRLRLAELESRDDSAERRLATEGLASKEELERLRADLDSGLARAVQSPELQRQISEALVELRRQGTSAKVRAQHERRREGLEQELRKVEQWLQLEPRQVDGMRAALLAQIQREEELARLSEQGLDDASLGARKASLRDAFQADLQHVLTEQQLESYLGKTARSGGGAK
jgi:hypothetical protein